MKYNCIVHNDADGVGCYIVLRAIPKLYSSLNKVYPTGYKYITDKIIKSKAEVDAIVIADLAITQEQADLTKDFNTVIFIDHHPTSEKINIKGKVRTHVSWSEDECATRLTFHRYAEYLGDKFGPIKELVDLINDYDVFKLKHKESLWLNELYWKYKFWDFAEIMKDGLNEEYLLEGRTLWEEKELRYSQTDHMRLGVHDETVVLFGTEFLTNAMIENPTNIISVNSPSKVSVRSRNSLTNFYSDITHMLKNDIVSVGGHKYAGGIDFNKNIGAEQILKIHEALEIPF